MLSRTISTAVLAIILAAMAICALFAVVAAAASGPRSDGEFAAARMLPRGPVRSADGAELNTADQVADRDFYRQRAWPGEIIPPGAYRTAIAQAQEDRRQTRRGLADVLWNPAGPTNIPGRITDIAVRESDLNTIYAATAAGGVFKSVDLGGSWTPIFDSVGPYAIGAVAVDPTNPQVVYVGTGEANGSFDSYGGAGVFKSVDGGLTWAHLGLDSSGAIGRIVVDPEHPDTLYVAAMGRTAGDNSNPERGLYRSENGGASWQQALFVDDHTGCIDVALHPSSGTLFAAMWKPLEGPTCALWRSTDHGNTWTMQQGIGELPDSGNLGRIGVTVCPVSERVYVTIVDGNSRRLLGLFRSDDLGDGWIRTNDLALLGSQGGFGWYFGQVRVAPTDPDIVYCLGVTLWKSTNGGASWSNVTGATHVDHHALYISPSDPDLLYGGCDGGVNYSDNGGDSWTVFRNMPNTQFYAVGTDFQNGERLYGGTQGNGTVRTLTGATDDWEEILPGSGFHCLINYRYPGVIYADGQYGAFYKSVDGGQSFTWAQTGIDPTGVEPRGWNTPVAMDVNNPSVLFFGTNRVYRTDNATEYWVPISPRFSEDHLSAIGVSPVDSEVIYAGAWSGGVYRTINGGTTWTSIAGGLPERWVTRLTPDPFADSVVYVALSGYVLNGSYQPHLYRSASYGDDWVDISGNLPQAPVNDVIVDPHAANILYAATDVGVYITENLGADWTPLGTGMPIVPVVDLEMNSRLRKLAAATHGRSMFSALIPCPDMTDGDGDGVGDLCDNCAGVSNAEQADMDADGIGVACDECVDLDRDGFGEAGFPAATCPEDNCPDIYNPDQRDLNNNGTGDACELEYQPVPDTIATDCVNLVINNLGNAGNGGSPRNSMDYADQGDCEDIYLYDASPVIVRIVDGDIRADYNLFGRNLFRHPSFGVAPTPVTDMGTHEYYSTGEFVTSDGEISLTTEWFAPRNSEPCSFTVSRVRVYAFDREAHDSITLGFFADWDIPSTTEVNNRGGAFSSHNLIFQTGMGYGCQKNQERFGGMALLGVGMGDSCLDTSVAAFGAYTASNLDYVYPIGAPVAVELSALMHQPGFRPSSEAVDQHAMLTYAADLTIGAADTLDIYLFTGTYRRGPALSFRSTVDAARRWLTEHVIGACSCCRGLRGNIDGSTWEEPTLGDLAALIDILFVTFAPPACPEEANVDGSADGEITLGDLLVLIDHLFVSFNDLPPCP